jgi:hypothetical protein
MAFRLEIWLFPIRLPEAVKVRGRSGGIFEQSEESVEAKRSQIWSVWFIWLFG